MNRRELLQLTMGSVVTGGKPEGVEAIERSPVRTGLKLFDKLTGGLFPGSLTVVYGDFKCGKTTLAMNVAEHVAVNERRPVLYLVQSFSAQTLYGQIASSRARVDWLDVGEGKLNAKETERFELASLELSAASLKIDDMPALSDTEIVERIESWAGEHPSGLAIVDHIRRDSWQAVDRCSQAIKLAAVKTGTAIIATAWHAPIEDAPRSLDGVGTSHADYSWHLFRWWCTSEDLSRRDGASLAIFDERTGEHRLSLETRLDQKFRRFRIIGTNRCSPSLRDVRLEGPDSMVYYRFLKPGEEPPPGSRLVYLSGVDPELDISAWESSS